MKRVATLIPVLVAAGAVSTSTASASVAGDAKRACNSINLGGPRVFYKHNMRCHKAKHYARRLYKTDGRDEPKRFACGSGSNFSQGARCQHDFKNKLFGWHPFDKRKRSSDKAPASKAKTQLVCLNGDGTEYRRKEQPKQCAIYARGGNIRWRRQPEEAQVARLGSFASQGDRHRMRLPAPLSRHQAKVRAWRPRERCGQRVYTRLEATTRYGHSRAGVQGCPGPAFRAAATSSHKPKGASDKPKVACWNHTFPTEQGTEDPQFYREPRKCIIFRHGAVSYAEGVVRAYKLHWKNWGRRRAAGKGKMFISTAGFFPLKIRLSKPRASCGRLVFSKVRYRIKNPNGDDFGGRFHPYTC